MGELSYVHFYPFSGTWDYQQKRDPIGVFLMLSYSLKLKALSSIYFLELAKNPRDRTTMVSLKTTPQKLVWQHSHFGSPLFRVLYNVSSLDPINIKSFYLPQVFPIYSDIPSITIMIPFPWVSFICCLVCPAIILWTKEVWVSHSPPAPVQFFLPSPPPQFSESIHRLLHTFRLSLALLVKETSLSWLGIGLSLSMPTQIFQRIDPEVPIPWFH